MIGGVELQRSPRTAESEFGGPLDPCDDQRFNCLTTGLHIAVPRGEIQERWSVSGLSCEAEPVAAEETLTRIVCRVDGRESSVNFLYSSNRGVISYRRVCPQCPPEEFVLVGDKGMFARVP